MDRQSLKEIVQQLKDILEVLESEVYSDPEAYETWKLEDDPSYEYGSGYDMCQDDDGDPD